MSVANVASKGLQMVKSTGLNLGDAINVGFAYSDYKGARNEGILTYIKIILYAVFKPTVSNI